MGGIGGKAMDWGAALCVVPLACFIALGSSRDVAAGVAGSKHDFSAKSIASGGGVCTPCHRVHYAPDSLGIWKRDLTFERSRYNQASNPNYVPTRGETLLCYDCHDDMVGGTEQDPDPLIWDTSQLGHDPQDVARGGTSDYLFKIKVLPTQPSPAFSLVGYYENADGSLPTGTNSPTDGSPTGGHYWKSNPSDNPDLRRQGDKISCSLCHDPHNAKTGDNKVLFRTVTGDGTGVVLPTAPAGGHLPSKNTRYGAERAPSYTKNGRSMCESCHGNSQGNDVSITFFTNVTPPKPTAGVIEHVYDANDSAVACTDCHPHNRPAGCNDCHGYPPLVATDFTRGGDGQSYPGGAGAHQRHKDALGPLLFKCEICHGPRPGALSTEWHARNASGQNTTTVLQANVDIIGQAAYWGAGSGYNGTTSGGFTDAISGVAFSFKAKGGPDDPSPTGRCSNLVCHGNPPASTGTVFLNWSDDMVDESTGNFVGDGAQICKWCHDATPASVDGGTTYAPGVAGDGTTFGADVNGHGLPNTPETSKYDRNTVGDAAGALGAGKTCTVCHDATYQAGVPTRKHFGAGTDPRDEKRLRDTINSATPNITASTTFPTGPDQACSACHQNGNATDGADWAYHGNNFADKKEGDFIRACRQCHEVHGSNYNGAGRNLYMIGKWIDVNGSHTPNAGDGAFVDSNATTELAGITSGDNAVVFTARTGANSFDEIDGAYNPANDTDDICATCHAAAPTAAPYNGAGTGGGSHAGVAGTPPDYLTPGMTDERGNDCTMCHEHDYEKPKNYATADAFMPSGCYGCHGDVATKQFWPNGTGGKPAYADDNAGAHENHVQAISRRVFGLTIAQLLADGNATEKQKQICRYCHPDPGGAGHTADSGDQRVDIVVAGAFGRFRVGAEPLPPAAPTPDATSQAYTYGAVTEGTCNNLVCHNQVATPFWNAVTDWTTPVPPTSCSNTTCHATGTYATNAHPAHVGAAGKGYACTECHANNYNGTDLRASLQHQNGEVDMTWNNAASIEGSVGAGNGYYNKDGVAGATAGDTAFAYKNGTYNVACNLVYCHGGDNTTGAGDWGGGTTEPLWNDTVAPRTTVYCGSCHDGNGSGPADRTGGTDVIASGNHTDHLTAAYGPGFANPPGSAATSCVGTLTTGCHTDFQIATATHVDGTVTFDNIAATPASSPLGTLAASPATATDTDRCSHCHSTASITVYNAAGVAVGPASGTALVKTQANWDNGAYAVPCLTCHNGSDAASTFADGTGRAAPDMLGTDAANGSGAEIRGHGLASGTYPVSANPAANQYCTACHSATVAHLNDSNDTTYAGNRLLGAVNGGTINGEAPTSVTGACNACHAKAGVATKNSVNMHANTGASYASRPPIEQGFPNPPTTAAMECSFCHEPHGMTANGAGYNIYMVPSTITVPTPGATAPSAGVRFEAKTGAYSYDDDDTEVPNAPDLCVVCHEANTMNQNVGGDHAAPGYDNNEEGSDCAGCHPHNLDGVVATADGFMPVQCNACHSYPGLAAAPHALSATHNVHVDPLPTGKGFTCGACHYQSSHNNAGMRVGQAWPAVTDAQKQVRFAVPAVAFGWNAMAAANNPADRTLDSTSFGDTTHVCANLYCHGADTPGYTPAFPAADAPSPYVAPDWDTATTGDCGTCHRYTAANPPGSNAHAVHAGSAAGQYAIGCAVCHYTTTNNGTSIAGMAQHVNTVVEVAFNAAADARVDGTSAYSANNDQIGLTFGACSATYCHSKGTDTTAPYDSGTGGTAEPAAALNWDAAGACWSCHGNAAVTNPSPAYTDGTPKANKHAIHTGTGDPATTANTNGYGCAVCHWPTTHADGSINTTTNHVNRVYNVDDDGVAPTLDQFTYTTGTPGTCGAANCHGGNDAISWGLAGPISCNTCHGMVRGASAAEAAGSDVNNFAGSDATQSKISNVPTSGDYETLGHGAKLAVLPGCDECHNSAVGHDKSATLTGANPFRLANNGGTGPGNFTCANTNAGCHASDAARAVRNHTRADVAASGWNPNVDIWGFTPKCVDCHDPHGDPANLHMIQRELAGGSADNWVPTAIETSTLVFSDDATGSSAAGTSYADLDSPFTSLCQACHHTTDPDFTSFRSGTSGSGTSHPAPDANPGDCSGCHLHSGAFAPTRCEGCHGTPPYDPGGGRAVAPDVVQGGVWDGSWWDSTQGGNDATQQGGHGDPDGKVAIECTGCHDVSLPAGYHLNGTVESTGPSTVTETKAPANVNANTAHLKARWRDGGGILHEAEFIATTGGENVQVQFDNTCSTKPLPTQTGTCHSVNGVLEHTSGSSPSARHSMDANSSSGQVTFGEHLSKPDGNNLSIHLPIDSDLTTVKSTAEPDYAPCVSCHDPHGTKELDCKGATDIASNKMLRFQWSSGSSRLCRICH